MVPASSILERRRDQMFPELDPFEIERMRRFAEARSFAQGEAIFTAGQVGPGLVVILSGEVDIIRRKFSNESLIVTDGPGQFMSELAQLAGRPALADADNYRSCSAPADKCCAIGASNSLRAVLVWFGPSIRGASTTLPLWEPGPQVLPPRSMLRLKPIPAGTCLRSAQHLKGATHVQVAVGRLSSGAPPRSRLMSARKFMTWPWRWSMRWPSGR